MKLWECLRKLAGVSWLVTEGTEHPLFSQSVPFLFCVSYVQTNVLCFIYCSGETEDTFIADLSVGLATVSYHLLFFQSCHDLYLRLSCAFAEQFVSRFWIGMFLPSLLRFCDLVMFCHYFNRVRSRPELPADPKGLLSTTR